MNVRINIMTFDRPQLLFALLSRLRECEEFGDDSYEYHVWDDGSPETPVIPDSMSVQIHCRGKQGGKERYARWFSEMVDHSHDDKSWDRLLILPDDVLPTHITFYKHLEATWLSIKGPKICLNPLATSRGPIRQWTHVEPMDWGSVWCVGWNDCCSYSERLFIKEIMGQTPGFHRRRWYAKPLLGSGVGMQISKRLVARGHKCHMVKNTLLSHGAHESKMNPVARSLETLEAN